jgi:hypothetical protein
MGKDLEGNGYALIELLSRHFLGGARVKQERSHFGIAAVPSEI